MQNAKENKEKNIRKTSKETEAENKCVYLTD